MEELRSTDILDKEIQSEARKKAQQIVDSANEQAKEILQGVEERLQKARAEKEEYYSAKEAKYKKDADSTLPLEKERFLVQFVASSIDGAIEEYLKKLSEEKRIALSLSVLDRAEGALKDKKLKALVYGFDPQKAKAAVEKRLGQKLVSCTAQKSADIAEGIILESEDLSVRARLTIDEVVDEAKDKYYREMADSLFGGRL